MTKISKRYGFSSVPSYFNAEKVLKIKTRTFAVYSTKAGYLFSEINDKNEVINTFGGKPCGVGRIGYDTAAQAIKEGKQEVKP